MKTLENKTTKQFLATILAASSLSAFAAVNLPASHSVDRGNIIPASELQRPADNTLQRKIQGPDGELLATQPGAIEVSTSKEVLGVGQLANAQYQQEAAMEADYKAAAAREAHHGKIKPAPKLNHAVNNTLQQKIHGPDGELLATQPGRVQTNMNDALNVVNLPSNNSSQYHSAPSALDNHSYSGHHAANQRMSSVSQLPNPTNTSFQHKVKDSRGELLATQPGEVAIQQSQKILPANHR